jgi:hypothetical protein
MNTESAPQTAATTVLDSPASEADASELVKTKRELEEERKARKQVELRAAELEDENRRLKTPPPPPPPKEKKSWMSGATFFG